MPSTPGLELLAPMLASAGPLPTGPGWAWEFKYDGVRAITYVDERVRVYSRNNNEITDTYPELAEAVDLLAGRRAVLDGEIVALDHDQPSFSLLQQRMHTAVPAQRLLQAVPVFYYVFDVLAVDGQDLTGQPYSARREILAGLGLVGEHVKVPAHFVDVDGQKMLQAAEIAGLEGVVAKRLTSPYRAGKRSADWTKVPSVGETGRSVGDNRRSETVGTQLAMRYMCRGQHGHAAPMRRVTTSSPLISTRSPRSTPARASSCSTAVSSRPSITLSACSSRYERRPSRRITSTRQRPSGVASAPSTSAGAGTVGAGCRRASPGVRSGRSPRQEGWRMRPSGVQLRKATSPTSTGSTQWACRACSRGTSDTGDVPRAIAASCSWS